MPHLLIVEDEKDLSRLMARSFQRDGFTVEEAATARAALQACRARPPSCVLLDLMLPDASGLDVCRALKADPATRAVPVVMVTAKGEEVDRVVGFELGADDYVAKPFSPRELVLRVKAILRRTAGAGAAAAPVSVGPLTVDEEGHRALVAGRAVALTATEFKLLAHLARHAGRVATREALLERFWRDASEGTTRTLDTHVKRLRRKLGPAGRLVRTVRGVGFRLAAEP
jgi:two-component system phosphate regulon response regulator PhoB